jgi:hypothetical protein
MVPYQQGQPLQQMPMQGLQQQPMQQPGTNLGNLGGKGITNSGTVPAYNGSGKGASGAGQSTSVTPTGFTTTSQQNQVAAQQAASADAQELQRFRQEAARQQQQQDSSNYWA